MAFGQRQLATGQISVRQLPLLGGERIEEKFVPEDGLVVDTPGKGHLLVLTNQRVISFVQSDGHNETFLAPLEELRGVSVRANTRGMKHVSQGLILIFLGILAYFVIGYILDGITIAAALGSAIIFVGALFIARYFFWEDEGSITFQGGNLELSFPYKSNIASADVYKLINRFFQLKLHTTNSHRSPTGWGPGDHPPPGHAPGGPSNYI